MSNHDLHVYYENLMPALRLLFFHVLKLIQSSREGQGENLNEKTNVEGLIYASLKGQPLLILISLYPSSTHEGSQRVTTKVNNHLLVIYAPLLYEQWTF